MHLDLLVPIFGIAATATALWLATHHGDLRRQRQALEKELRGYREREPLLQQALRVLRAAHARLAREAGEPKP